MNWRPKRGETVRWKEAPEVKSKVTDIVTYYNGFFKHKKERYYYLENGMKCTIDEIIKL